MEVKIKVTITYTREVLAEEYTDTLSSLPSKSILAANLEDDIESDLTSYFEGEGIDDSEVEAEATIKQQDYDDLKKEVEGGRNPKDAKVMLAKEITARFHSAAAAEAAEQGVNRIQICIDLGSPSILRCADFWLG